MRTYYQSNLFIVIPVPGEQSIVIRKNIDTWFSIDEERGEFVKSIEMTAFTVCVVPKAIRIEDGIHGAAFSISFKRIYISRGHDDWFH